MRWQGILTHKSIIFTKYTFIGVCVHIGKNLWERLAYVGVCTYLLVIVYSCVNNTMRIGRRKFILLKVLLKNKKKQLIKENHTSFLFCLF